MGEEKTKRLIDLIEEETQVAHDIIIAKENHKENMKELTEQHGTVLQKIRKIGMEIKSGQLDLIDDANIDKDTGEIVENN